MSGQQMACRHVENPRHVIQDLTDEQICERFNYILHEEIHQFPEIPVADMIWVLYVFNKKTISWEYQQIMKQKRMLSVDHEGHHYKIMLKDKWRHFALRCEIPRDVEDEFETNWEDARDETPEPLIELNEPANMDDPEDIPMNATPNPDDQILENVLDQQNLLEGQRDREDESAGTSGNEEMATDESHLVTISETTSNSGEDRLTTSPNQGDSSRRWNEFENETSIEDEAPEESQVPDSKHSDQSKNCYSGKPSPRQNSEEPDQMEENSEDNGESALGVRNSSSWKGGVEAEQFTKLDGFPSEKQKPAENGPGIKNSSTSDELTAEKSGNKEYRNSDELNFNPPNSSHIAEELVEEEQTKKEIPVSASNASQSGNFINVEEIDEISSPTKHACLQRNQLVRESQPANTFSFAGKQKKSNNLVSTIEIKKMYHEPTRWIEVHNPLNGRNVAENSKQPLHVSFQSATDSTSDILDHAWLNKSSTATPYHSPSSAFDRLPTRSQDSHQEILQPLHWRFHPRTGSINPSLYEKMTGFAKKNTGNAEKLAKEFIGQNVVKGVCLDQLIRELVIVDDIYNKP